MDSEPFSSGSPPGGRKPDYSEYLTPERLEVEERLWEEVGIHHHYAAAVTAATVLLELDRVRVIELGCGTGFVPRYFPERYEYLGVDANPLCLELARRKNPGREFIQADIRTIKPGQSLPFPPGGYGIMCSFAVWKHFMPDEWEDVVCHMLSLATIGVFSMPISPDGDVEDGVDYPHTLVTMDTLEKALRRAGHRITCTALKDTIEPIFTTKRYV